MWATRLSKAGVSRGLAQLARWLDANGDDRLDVHDFLDGDRDGSSDVIGLLLFIIKILSIALCVLAWNTTRVYLKKRKRRRERVDRDLLIFACSPRLAQLPNAVLEATEVSRVFAASIFARGDVTAEALRCALFNVPTRRFLFIGHADAPMSGAKNDALRALSLARHLNEDRTLGFVTQDGSLAAARPSDLATLLGRHGADRGGPLELVVLNGCRSLDLARAVQAAGVPFVVCWRTKAHDAAARLFSKAFFEALGYLQKSERRRSTLDKRLDQYAQAFREALDSIRFETRPGTLANGVRANVPRFELKDPNDDSDDGATDCTPLPTPAGLPTFLTSRPDLHDGVTSPISSSLRRRSTPLLDNSDENTTPDDKKRGTWGSASRCQLLTRLHGNLTSPLSDTHLPR